MNCYLVSLGFPGGTSGKEPASNAGDARDVGSIPGWGRSPRVGNGNHSSILACEMPWTEESGRLQTMKSQDLGMIEGLII